jgi:hypothetical protein
METLVPSHQVFAVFRDLCPEPKIERKSLNESDVNAPQHPGCIFTDLNAMTEMSIFIHDDVMFHVERFA